jgi:uncharacterized protein (DUF305 family)
MNVEDVTKDYANSAQSRVVKAVHESYVRIVLFDARFAGMMRVHHTLQLIMQQEKLRVCVA